MERIRGKKSFKVKPSKKTLNSTLVMTIVISSLKCTVVCRKWNSMKESSELNEI